LRYARTMVKKILYVRVQTHEKAENTGSRFFSMDPGYSA
jgi:hypothetical protein